MKPYSDCLCPDRLAIFLLHGVIDRLDTSVRNYTRKHLEKDYFRAVLTNLTQKGTPLSMDEVIRCHENGEPYPPFAFAITFDDGFENNYSVAAPLLAELGIPATFYVSTDFIESNTMSWIDRIEFCLENTARGDLRLPWNGSRVSFRDIDSKKRVLEGIRHAVKASPAVDPDGVAESVFSQCGMQPVTEGNGPLDRKMSWPQVRALQDHPLFTVGGHSHRHVNLAFLGKEVMEKEISLSIRLLKERASIESAHYSYPEGLEHCFSDDVIAALRRHGVLCSPTAIEGTNPAGGSLFHLRRIMVT